MFNTIENLTSQDEQVAVFANAAAHLAPGGRFVVEVEVPSLAGLPSGERGRVFDLGPATSASTRTTTRSASCFPLTTGR